MKRTITVCVLVLITAYAFSQKENYLSGYIVKNYFDTTRGFINDQRWKSTPEQVSFKSDAGSVTDYTPVDITSFFVSGRLFESVLVDLEISPDNPEKLTSRSDFITEQRKVFLDAIIPGEKGLYLFQPPDGKRNFYIKFNGKHQLLLYKSYLADEGSKKVAGNNKFREQLLVFLAECPPAESDVQTATYSRKPLEKIVWNFFTCTGRQLPDRDMPKDRISPKFTTLAGASVSFIKFRSKTFPYLAQGDFNSSVNFMGGAGLEIFPGKSGTWSFVNELVYLYYKFEGDYVNDVSVTQYESAHTEFFNQYIKLNTLLRLNVPINRSLLFFNTGLSNGYALSLEGTQRQYKRLADVEQYNDLEPYDKEQRYEIGVLVGSGFTHRRMTYQIRFESSNGFTVAPQLTSKVNSLRFLVSYQFNYEED